MVIRITFDQPILRGGQEEDNKAAELGFHIDNIRFQKDDKVSVLIMMAKNESESIRFELSVAHIYSGIVTDENDLVEDKGKSCYTYRVHLDNGWVMCNVYPVRMRKIT